MAAIRHPDGYRVRVQRRADPKTWGYQNGDDEDEITGSKRKAAWFSTYGFAMSEVRAWRRAKFRARLVRVWKGGK